MARDVPASSRAVGSPQKRRLAPPSSSSAAWSALEPSASSTHEATPRRRLATNVERASKSRLKASAAHESDLEDGLNLINTFGDLAMCASLHF